MLNLSPSNKSHLTCVLLRLCSKVIMKWNVTRAWNSLLFWH